MDAALLLENVSVTYPIRALPRAGARGSLLRLAYGGAAKSGTAPVLRNIWLTLGPGDRLGVIGRNGSGKSTLLRTMAGIQAPRSGRVWSRGVVAPILSASVGFMPQATGQENIFLRGMLLGMSKAEIRGKVDSILSFADLGDWIYQPISTYSSGMTLRLAFAICTSMEPDVLIVDEWIGAGDSLFMQRARERLQDLVRRSSILVLASHSDAILRSFCNRSIVIESGAIVFDGPTPDALAYYGELIEISNQARDDARPQSPFGEPMP
jgi:ABC-type polysaccharide/polyol phosphate transport system ATPase subunit